MISQVIQRFKHGICSSLARQHGGCHPEHQLIGNMFCKLSSIFLKRTGALKQKERTACLQSTRSQVVTSVRKHTMKRKINIPGTVMLLDIIFKVIDFTFSGSKILEGFDGPTFLVYLHNIWLPGRCLQHCPEVPFQKAVIQINGSSCREAISNHWSVNHIVLLL